MDTNIRLNTKLIMSLSRVILMPAAEIIAVTSINRSTWYRILQNPLTITVQQLLALANGLHIPVQRFFSTGPADVIGRRGDYVTEPYLPCSYDADTLQSTVYSRQDISWQQAADATGVTRDNFRYSLIAARRTPVTRLLEACRVWDIDPFEILVDPNPDTRHKRKPGTDGGLGVEIGELRRDIGRLWDTVDDLKRKYETLLDAHKSLAKRINVNFGDVNGGHISIATDPLPDPEPDKRGGEY